MAAPAAVFVYLSYLYLSLPDVRVLATSNPPTTAFIELRAREARADGKTPRRVQRWVRYERISNNLRRAVLVAEDSAFWDHDGVDLEQLKESIEQNLEKGKAAARRQHHHAAAGQEPLPVAVAQSHPQAARAADHAQARGVADQAAHPRAVPQRDRMGRRHLRRRGGGAHVLRQVGGGAVGRAGGAAGRRDHQPARAQPGPSDGAAAAPPADHPAADGRGDAAAGVAGHA